VRSFSTRYLLVAALIAASPAAADPSASAGSERPLRIVTFGTSLTASGRWQSELGRQLTLCLGRPVDVVSVAKSGQTSRWGLANVERVIAAQPDVVTIEFAANDAALYHFFTVGSSASEMRRIASTILGKLPDARVLLMTMNPIRGFRQTLLRSRVPEFHRSYHLLARELGIGLVDNEATWAGMSADALAAAIPDGLHPTPAAAAAVIIPNIKAVLAPGCE
jgi:lysophospholipase L1-like esterase